ncbi:hypothetical protein Tco_0897483 [Tanacetum coccineum]
MDTTVHYEEPSGQASSLFTVPITVIPEIMSTFTTTIPPPLPSFNPLPQQATPTPTPTASEVTTSFLALPDFSSIFRFNDRITTLPTNKVKPFNKPSSPILQNVEKKLLLKRGTALAVLITGASQSRQHVVTSLIRIESHKSPTMSLLDVGSSRISIFIVNDITRMFWQNHKDNA